MDCGSMRMGFLEGDGMGSTADWEQGLDLGGWARRAFI